MPPAKTSINAKNIFGYGIKISYPTLDINDIKLLLNAPVKLAWDSLFEGLSQIYKGCREDVLYIISRFVKVGAFMADCVRAIADAISKESDVKTTFYRIECHD